MVAAALQLEAIACGHFWFN